MKALRRNQDSLKFLKFPSELRLYNFRVRIREIDCNKQEHYYSIDRIMSKTSAPTSLFSVPDGQATNVRIIDTTSYVKDTALSAFLGPPMSGYSTFSVPAFSFLVEHASGRKILFDLGIRKDYWNMSPTIVSITKDWNVKVEKNVSEILVENGVDLAEIEAVIWRLVTDSTLTSTYRLSSIRVQNKAYIYILATPPATSC